MCFDITSSYRMQRRLLLFTTAWGFASGEISFIASDDRGRVPTLVVYYRLNPLSHARRSIPREKPPVGIGSRDADTPTVCAWKISPPDNDVSCVVACPAVRTHAPRHAIVHEVSELNISHDRSVVDHNISGLIFFFAERVRRPRSPVVSVFGSRRKQYIRYIYCSLLPPV